MKPSMLARLDQLANRLEEINSLLMQEGVTDNMEQYRKLNREHAELGPLVDLYQQYTQAASDVETAQGMLADPDMKEFAQEEIGAAKARMEQMEIDLQKLLLPKDPNDEKNIILEIRAGTGGDEAALFAAELFRMYGKFAERQGWRVDVMSMSETGVGGIKEVIANIQGRGVYSKLKYESGVHRVQRVPATEASGRIHTSTATVAVLPEVEDVDVAIDLNDLQIDVYRSSGPGGQSVNTTDSAVRITHKPSGIVVSMQDEKSQLQNRERAMRVLRARLYEQALAEQQAELAADRRSQVGTGERAEKIRTYNFPQRRVTDHRVEGLTVHNLEQILGGELDEISGALEDAEKRRRLELQAAG